MPNTSLPKIKSNFAILDVKSGRKGLANYFASAGAKRVPVTITGFIDGTWGSDDGTSLEFEVDVKSVVLGKVA